MNMKPNHSEDKVSLEPQQALQLFSGPLFVSGVWRSGTSLLYALLNQHPDMRLFYEGDLPVLWPMFRVGYSRKNWLERWEYWNAAVSRHGLDSFQPSAPITSLAEAFEAAGREYCRTKGARIWGCKSPSYYNRLVDLACDFPAARFIIIWRDPEEICRSVIKAADSSRYFAASGMLHLAILACEMLKKQCDSIVSRGIPVHQIHHKQLVGDTAQTMRGICDFLDVPFVSAITSLEGADRGAIFAGAHHSMVMGTQIVSSRERRATLPSRIEKKVGQYKALWKEEYGEAWILSRYLGDPAAPNPSRLARMMDRFLFFVFRFKEAVPPLAFSILPLWFWRLYRTIKYQNPDYIKHHNRATIDEPSVKKERQYAADQRGN
jgi:Sulfotransferase family